MLPLRFKSYKNNLKRFNSYDFKLSSSISRTKKMIYEYALNNNFSYFVTFTFNNTFNSYDLGFIHRHLTQTLRDCNKKSSTPLKWLLIPEKHKKGDYHLHGLLSSEFKQFLYTNEHLYNDFIFFKKYGFCNVQEIRNYDACCKYITKYITKDLFLLDKGKHTYFISRNLKKSVNIYDIVIKNGSILNFDFSNDYCSIKEINLKAANKYIENIFNNHFYNYYNNITK